MTTEIHRLVVRLKYPLPDYTHAFSYMRVNGGYGIAAATVVAAAGDEELAVIWDQAAAAAAATALDRLIQAARRLTS